MWRQRCVCNNRLFLCRGKPLSVIDHGTHQPQSIIYWYKGNSGKALWHRSTIDCSWCSFRMWHSWLPPWYHQYEVVKALPAGIELNHLGDQKASLDDVMKESTHFISACYEQKTYPPDTMHWARYKVLVSRTGRKGPTAAQYPSETKVTATYYGSLLEIRDTKAGSFSSLYLESCSATWSTRTGSTWVW